MGFPRLYRCPHRRKTCRGRWDSGSSGGCRSSPEHSWADSCVLGSLPARSCEYPRLPSPNRRGSESRRSSSDRHRGGGHPPTPATPPCIRVRTRRFESVTLTVLEQGGKSERFEVRIRESKSEGLGPCEIPRAVTTASRITGQPRTHPEFQQSRSTTAGSCPLPPQSRPEAQ